MVDSFICLIFALTVIKQPVLFIMNSRISIDVNEDNQPVIMIDYVDSADVRDKLVRRFMQGFGEESNFARIEYISHPSLAATSRMVITPVSDVLVEYEDPEDGRTPAKVTTIKG